MEELDEPNSWVVPELLIRFMRATFELNRCDMRRTPEHEGGLPVQQIRALLYLVRHEGTTIKELARALSVSEARASRLAEELAEAGHVLHQRDPLDRRQVRLQVAPAAAETAQRMYRERAGALRVALQDASEEEISTFTRLLTRIVDEFEALARHAAEPAQPDLPAVDSAVAEPLSSAKLP